MSGRPMTILARGLLVVAAVVAVAWLAGGLRSLDRIDAGVDVIHAARGKPPDPSTLRRAKARFDSARRFNDDTDILVREAAALLFLKSSRSRAATLARRATEREPENATAWLLLYGSTRGEQPELADRARRRAIQLDPKGTASLAR